MEIAYQTIKLFQKRKYKKNEKKLLKRLLELAKEHAYHIYKINEQKRELENMKNKI